MDDLEVEPVTDLTTDDAADYVLYGGKGGVGKTTMAAATGVASAAENTATLIVSTDPAHSLSDVFETQIGTDPTPVEWVDGLWAVEIDPEQAMEQADFFGDGGSLNMGGIGELLGGDGDSTGPMMPGADEAAAIQQLLRFLDDDRFDRVVVDTAPTGHTLRLLELPETLDSMMGRFLQFRDRLTDLLGSFGGDDAADSPGLDEMRDRIERLRSVLRDGTRTDFRLVMVPEELSVRETTMLRDRVESMGIPVETLVVNRVMEPPADVASIDADVVDAPDLSSCSFCQRRWQVQQDALESAQDLFRGVTVYRVPLLADAVAGPTAIEVIASCLDS